MFAAGQNEPRLAFPRLPETVKPGFSTRGLTLRPFGLYEEDLDVDFDRTPRPFLVTQILERCTRDHQQEKLPQDFFWDLTVGKRIECLLKLISPEAQTKIAVTRACSNESCRQDLEIELLSEEISALQEEAYANEHVSMKFENGQLTLRRPTATDQLSWLNSRFANEATAINEMVRTLCLPAPGESLTEEATVSRASSIQQCLDEHDPLIDFKVVVHCPYCEAENFFQVDLQEVSLRRLRQAQLGLLASVHNLARYYHWSEQQIFSVPYWRRAHYLDLIDRENS